MHLYGARVADLIGMTGDQLVKIFQEQVILDPSKANTYGKTFDPKEVLSWKNSLPILIDQVNKAGLSNLYIIFEYKVPISKKRIDAILVGYDHHHKVHGLIIELKQWTNIDTTFTDYRTKVILKDDPARTLREHPVAQTLTYRSHMQMNHENVVNKKVGISVLHYLHNFPLEDKQDLFGKQYNIYRSLTKETFMHGEESLLQGYLQQIFSTDPVSEEYRLITEGAYAFGNVGFNAMDKAFSGEEFVTLLDEQREISSRVAPKLRRFKPNENDKRLVIIVKGDTGTGKSILGMDFIKRFAKYSESHKCAFTTPSKTLKEVLEGYTETAVIKSTYDAIREGNLDMMVVDEAHRLENIESMMPSVLDASKIIVLLQDDNQRIKISEQGTVQNIRTAIDTYRHRKGVEVEILEYKLEVQKRSAYSSNYIEAITRFLSDDPSPSPVDIGDEFELTISDNLEDIDDKLHELDKEYRCKWLAPFCWKWTFDRKNKDVVIGSFEKPWNPSYEKFPWYIGEVDTHLEEIGCIYTSQGLEYDYGGVIFWDDLYWDGEWKVNLNRIHDTTFINEIIKHYGGYPQSRPKGADTWYAIYNGTRYEIHDFLALHKGAIETAKDLVKNVYRVLLSRMQKGSYLYFRHSATRDRLKSLKK